jgi:hypothetical protein
LIPEQVGSFLQLAKGLFSTVLFLILVMSLFLNVFLMTKVYNLALANHSYRKTVKDLTKTLEYVQEKTLQLTPSDSQKQAITEALKKKPSREEK